MSELRDLVVLDDALLEPQNKDAREIRLNQLRSKFTAMKAEMLELNERSKGETFDAGDQRRWDALKTGVERAKTAIERLGDVDRNEMLKLVGTKSELRTDIPPATAHFNANFNRQAFDPSNDDGLVGRAKNAVENCEFASDTAKHNAVKLIERSATDPNLEHVEKYLYSTSHPLYISAFRKYVADPELYRNELTAAEVEVWRSVNRPHRRTEQAIDATWGERAAMSLTAGNGGVMVPQFLDPTINIINASSYSQIREISDVITITTDQWDGVTSLGVDAAWTAELVEVGDSSPTFYGPQIPAHKAAAWLFGSYEVLQDSGFDQVAELLADAKNRLEAVAHISGSGNNQPHGLIQVISGTGPAVTGTSSTAGVAGTYDLAIPDFYKMDNALAARWRPNASWLMAKPTTNTIRQRASELPSQTVWSDLGNDTPPSLIGYPVYRNEEVTHTLVSGTVQHVAVLGDFRAGYKVIDRVGMSILYEPIVKSTGNGRPLGAAGWYGLWRTGANTVSSSCFKVLAL